MKNWKAIVGVVAVFLLGMVAGGIITHRIYQHRLRAFLRGGPAVAEMITRRLNAELDLNRDQRAKVLEIVRDSQRQLRKERQKPQPEFRRVLQDTEQRIRAVLTPEQQAKYDKYLAERKAQWQSLGPPPLKP